LDSPYNDVLSFAALSQVLEGVGEFNLCHLVQRYMFNFESLFFFFFSTGASAYTGAAASIVTPAYLTVAASILSTEARHASWVASAVNRNTPWSGPFEVSLAKGK
jgi:hypothetical protein